MSSKVITVAVLFASNSGMGDVGRFAAMHGLKVGPSLKIRPVALEWGTPDPKIEADVTDGAASGNERLKAAFNGVDIAQLDCTRADIKEQLMKELEGVDSVVACVGNRQPSMPRWCEAGSRIIHDAMKAKEISRLVIISSVGIGEDFMPVGCFTLFWSLLLHTAFRDARRDLTAMEKFVTGTDLDYLVVKPMGLTPSEPPTGSHHIITKKGSGTFNSISVAKEDVGAFMLKEAREPSIHRTCVTIGRAN